MTRTLQIRAFALVGALLGLLPRSVAAQPPALPTLEGSTELSFVGTSGNASTQSVGLAGEVRYRRSPWESTFRTAYVRNKSEGKISAQNIQAAGRVQRRLRSRMSGYAQYAYLRDRFAGLLARNTAEGGLAFSWLEGPVQTLAFDAGIGYASEHRVVGSNLSTGTAGAGAAYRVKISQTSDVSEDVRVVASLSERRDWRLTNTVAVTAAISRALSLKVSNNIRRLNKPVAGFRRTDTTTAVALVAKF
jgi:putative salt-induced outer membrane protein YdiY